MLITIQKSENSQFYTIIPINPIMCGGDSKDPPALYAIGFPFEMKGPVLSSTKIQTRVQGIKKKSYLEQFVLFDSVIHFVRGLCKKNAMKNFLGDFLAKKSPKMTIFCV